MRTKTTQTVCVNYIKIWNYYFNILSLNKKRIFYEK